MKKTRAMRKAVRRSLHPTAVHEAGHIVVGFAAGFGTEKVTIVPTEECLGEHFSFFLEESKGCKWNVLAECLLQMAGVATEPYFGYRAREVEGNDETNIHNAYQVLKDTNPNLSKVQVTQMMVHMLVICELLVVKIIEANLEAIKDIAAMLIEHKTLQGGVVDARCKELGVRLPPRVASILQTIGDKGVLPEIDDVKTMLLE